ncbi:MAG: hypothetical protein KAW89_07875 [Armatimonadetes bacterium]|nr:hypothetical protein [Armatimonadota bacterium]
MGTIMMSSHERVRRAIEFAYPDRVPLFFERLGHSDIAGSGYKTLAAISQREARDKGLTEWVDEWGAIWNLNPEASHFVDIGYIATASLQDYSLLAEYPFPDPDDHRRYENIEFTLRRQTGKYIQSSWFTLFEQAWQLRGGVSNLFLDMYDNPYQLAELLTVISDFAIRVITNLHDFAGRIHGIWLGDDWGTQSSTFLSIDQFRRFFKPHYKKIIDAAHRGGMHVWLHSDGKINDLIEEFIDIGLDVINLEQPLLVGIDDISDRYQGRIAFCPIIDIQKTLITGSQAEIEAQAKDLIQKWGMLQGGIIGYGYEPYEALGIDEERARFALNAWRKHGKYDD